MQWAHQGGAKEGPSNTLWAMRRAVAVGANALECDVHRTRDGHLVLAHDKKLGRLTDARGAIARMTVRELQRADAAYWWVPGSVDRHDAAPEDYVLRGRAPDDPSLRIPTLDALLDEFPSHPLTIEVKAYRAAGPLLRLLAERRRRGVTVTSFRTPIVWRMRWARWRLRLPPDAVGVAPGAAFTLWFWLRVQLRLPARRGSAYQRLQVPPRLGPLTVVTPRFVAAAHRAGMAVDAWTIDDAGEMHRLLHLGVDGIMTDVPSVLAEVVRRTSASD